MRMVVLYQMNEEYINRPIYSVTLRLYKEKINIRKRKNIFKYLKDKYKIYANIPLKFKMVNVKPTWVWKKEFENGQADELLWKCQPTDFRKK